jgi:hypothetical protein
MLGQQRCDASSGMGHQEILTSTTPWLGSANCAKPDGDMSTTRGYPACSRSSTVQVVRAPVTMFVTVKTVPKGSVGLAHIPGGAAAYHVACPRSSAPAVVGCAAAGTVTGVTLGATVVVTGAPTFAAAVCFGMTGPTGVGGAVVEVEVVTGVGECGVLDPGATDSYLTFCEGRTTL